MNFLDYFALLLLAISAVNFFAVKTLKPIIGKRELNADILVPMRNESKNVAPLIKNLLGENIKIIVLDDNSTDSTLIELDIFKDDISILRGKDLPEGWLGKNFACHQLAIHSNSDYLVFIDADVRLERGAINSAIGYLEDLGWDYISPYPKQQTSGPLQFLIQPLLQWSWFATIPFVLAYRKPRKSMAVANGQFFIVKKDAYLKSGGHKSIKSEVLDDIELARLLIGAGYKGGPVDGSKLATCHMYKSDRELLSGYSKSLWRAFGTSFGSLMAIAILIATAIPFIYFSIGAVFIFISRLIIAIKVRSNPISVLFHPMAMMILSIMIIRSHYYHRFGRLEWKDRTIK